MNVHMKPIYKERWLFKYEIGCTVFLFLCRAEAPAETDTLCFWLAWLADVTTPADLNKAQEIKS